MNDLFVEIEGNYSEYARTLINSLRKPWFKLKKKKNNIFKKEQVNNKGSYLCSKFKRVKKHELRGVRFFW